MARVSHKEHMSHSLFKRARRAKIYLAFLAERVLSLATTGSAYTFVKTALVKATGTLSMTGVVTNTETVTVDGVTYTFVTALTSPAVPFEVLIGAGAAASMANLAAAITGGVGEGTTYGTGTTAHTTVTAEGTGDTATVTALAGGRAGNRITTVSALADGSFGDPTLTGGGKDADFTVTGHGLAVGDGPFVHSTTGVLPLNMVASAHYWVSSVLDINTLTLSTARGGAGVEPSDAGTGVHTLTKGESASAVHQYVKRNGATVTAAATDVDNL